MDPKIALLEEAASAYWNAANFCQSSSMFDEMRACRRRSAELRLQVAHLLDAKANPWHAKISP